jgi:flavodoxin
MEYGGTLHNKLMEKSIFFVCSYHHKNTLKIADTIAAKIKAQVIEINNNANPTELETYDLIGFGAEMLLQNLDKKEIWDAAQ